jgi:hypothetical protein
MLEIFYKINIDHQLKLHCLSKHENHKSGKDSSHKWYFRVYNSALFGGVGFFVWRYSSINSHVEKLRTDGQLDAYLKKFSESNSYQFDEMIQTLENHYSRKVI